MIPRRAWCFSFALAPLLACAAQPSPRVSAALAEVSPADPPSDAPGFLGPEPEEDAAIPTLPAATPCRALVWTKECPVGEPEPPGSEVAAADFFAARKARPPRPHPDDNGCRVVHTRQPDEDVLVCHRSGMVSQLVPMRRSSPYRLETRVLAFAVRQGRVVRLLDAPFLVDRFDKDDFEEGPLFQLRLVVDEAGRLALRPPAAGACDVARARLAEEAAMAGTELISRSWVTFDRKLLERLCATAMRFEPRSPPEPRQTSSSPLTAVAR